MMSRAQMGLSAVVAVVVIAAILLVRSLTSAPSSQLELTFSAMAGDQPLVFNEFKYINPEGDERFQIRDFRFYLSNIVLHSDSGAYEVPDSYHLVRFDGENPQHKIILKDIPLRRVNALTFSIGVDEVANSSIEARGDLDPNSRMAWNWEVGYKFVLVEGGVATDDRLLPLVYHVGFSENLKPLSFAFSKSQDLADTKTIDFTVDLLKMFSGETRIDLVELNTVKFDRSDAARLANNYKDMIALAEKAEQGS